MRLDAEQIIAGIPLEWRRSPGPILIIRAIVDAFNAAIDSALYSLDPTALERLGTLIAEHALRVREIPRASEVPESDLETRLRRCETLLEAMLGPQTISTGMTFRSLDAGGDARVGVSTDRVEDPPP